MRQGRGSDATEAIFRLQAKKPLHAGVRTGCHCVISLSLLSVCLSVCVAFVVYTDCESCTRPISTNTVSTSMEAGEYGLTHGTCFVARRLEVVEVARLLCNSWCVLGAAGFTTRVCVIFFFVFFLFERTRPAASMRLTCLIYVSTSTRVRKRCHYLNSMSVRLPLYV